MRKISWTAWATVVSVALAVSMLPVLAEDTGWSDTAEFSLVAADGNTESTSLGFKNVLARSWDKADLTFRLGGIRVESTTDRFVRQGSNEATNETDTTAEAYYFNGRYDREITDRLFWYAGAGWDKNEFAGIDSRSIVEAGLGNIWRDTDDLKFRTNYGVTYTDQQNVVDDPQFDETFFGWRVGWDYLNKLGSNTMYTNLLTIDGNADESEDWRADMDNGLSVALNDKVALKFGLRLLYDNLPSLESLPVRDLAGNLTGGTQIVELDELDTIFTASVVINFL